MADPGPLPGIYQEFLLPITKDPTKKKPTRGTEPGVEKYERAYMKEALGFFLHLPVAPNRTGTFKGSGSNKDRKFNYRKHRASNSYTVLLLPDTDIKCFGRTKEDPTFSSKTLKKNSFSFSVPRTVGLAEMMAWFCNPDTVLGILWSAMQEVEGNEDEGSGSYTNYEKIIGLISPGDRRHNVATLLDSPEAQNIESDPFPATGRDPAQEAETTNQ